MRIMQSIKIFFAASLSLIAIMFAGCEPQIDPNNPPIMELDTYQLNVTGEGGDIRRPPVLIVRCGALLMVEPTGG